MLTLKNICLGELSEIDRLEHVFDEEPSLETAEKIMNLWTKWKCYNFRMHIDNGPSPEKVNAIIGIYRMIVNWYYKDQKDNL